MMINLKFDDSATVSKLRSSYINKSLSEIQTNNKIKIDLSVLSQLSLEEVKCNKLCNSSLKEGTDNKTIRFSYLVVV